MGRRAGPAFAMILLAAAVSSCGTGSEGGANLGGATNEGATGGNGQAGSRDGNTASTGTDGSSGRGQGGEGGRSAADGGARSGGGGSAGDGGASSGDGGSAGEAGATSGDGGSAGDGDGGSGGNGSAQVGADCASDGDGKTTLVFVNGCSDTLSFRGSDIDGGTLAPGTSACVDIGSDVEALSAKRYWGFVGEDPGAEHHTLAEFTFNTDFNDFDWYNISHVDAFNLPMQIVPLERDDCQTLTCADDLVPDCPEVGRFEDANGDVVACVSPDRNDGSSEVALYFEQCEDAYAWSGDDQNGDDASPVRACAGEDWNIVFCPEGGT